MENNNIGIWGLGSVGASAIRFFAQRGYTIGLMDKKKFSETEKKLIAQYNVICYQQENADQFFAQHRTIIPSPGIDLRPYAKHMHKWKAELDLFHKNWHKPIIAITGSVGKTTITHILSKLLEQSGKRVATGGNIGTPMLDFINNQNRYDIALLEVSSFQLALCQRFAPDLAIWTNFYPNHLDRHGSLEDYFDAKCAIVIRHNLGQKALLPLDVYNKMAKKYLPKSTLSLFSSKALSKQQLEKLPDQTSLFFMHNDTIFLTNKKKTIPLLSLNSLPPITFDENWLILCAALYNLSVPLEAIAIVSEIQVPEHRLEKVTIIDGVTFYNDSKSTTPQSTLAAVNALHDKPIHLLLGGLGKGLDRNPLIKSIANKVEKIYCFGKEANELKKTCDAYAIASESFATLEDAFAACTRTAHSGNRVLFSPAGSSFDLFDNYRERGKRFKELIAQAKQLRKSGND